MTESEIVSILFMISWHSPLIMKWHWLRKWFGTKQVGSHYLNQGWLSPMHNDKKRSEGIKISKFHCRLIAQSNELNYQHQDTSGAEGFHTAFIYYKCKNRPCGPFSEDLWHLKEIAHDWGNTGHTLSMTPKEIISHRFTTGEWCCGNGKNVHQSVDI